MEGTRDEGVTKFLFDYQLRAKGKVPIRLVF
jgi:hypothetical protein